MKEKIYNVMENVIGWNLYGNFDDVVSMDKAVLEKNWQKLESSIEKREIPSFTLEELETLKDAIGFAIDYMDAVGIIEKDKEV